MHTEYCEVNADQIDDTAIEVYRRCGFIVIRGLLTPDEAARYREAALSAHERIDDHHARDTRLDQFVNAWEKDAVMRELTLSSRVGQIAERLTGAPMRLWHDHILIKKAHNKLATEFHQDQAYWPHDNSPNALSVWIALDDVPQKRGCMTFIPGSHVHRDLPRQDLGDDNSLFTIAPELTYQTSVTCPLRVGDCTFHHARTAHRANANMTDKSRPAHVIAYMDAATTYKPRSPDPARKHVVMLDLDVKPGQVIDHDRFPTVEQMVAGEVTAVS